MKVSDKTYYTVSDLQTDENNAFMLGELFVRSRPRPLEGCT